MNTSTHIILGAAVFARADAPKVTYSAFAGGLIPDVSLLALTIWTIYFRDIPPRIVFGGLYFSDSWQAIFAVDNSMVLWGLLLAIALWLRRDWLVALTGAALLHLVFDFLLHHDDAKQHFWPLTDWVFQSPVSYWDTRFYGDIFAPIEFTGLVAMTVFLLWRLSGAG